MIKRLLCLLLFSIILGFTFVFPFGCSRQAANQAASADATNTPFEEAPIQIKSVNPIFPPDAVKEGITGIVWVKVRLDTTGAITDAVILQNSGKNVGFEQAALDAAYKCKWKPAKSNGKPIETWVTYKVDFDFK